MIDNDESASVQHEISSLREETKQIKLQAAKGDKVNVETYVNLYPMNENETSVHKMKSWFKKLECLEKMRKTMFSKT